MKKLRFFKALFVAAALALMIPGCSDVNSDEGTNIPQTQGNKVALKISASEGYRTALPTVDLTSYTYELTADEVTGNTAANNPATLIPAGTSYSDLTKANSVYVEADKNYLFALKATNGSSGDILSGTLTKAISASDSTLSFQLFAIDSTSDTGSVSISVTYDDGYGVASVVPTLHKTDGTSLSTVYPLTYTAGDTAGTGTITGSVPVGASYVNVVLKDESSTEIGSLPQEAVYAVKGLTSSGTVNVQVKKYKATIALTTSDSSAPPLTLKNPAITTEGYAGIPLTSSSETSPYTYTGYVPVGTYAIFIGDADEPVSGKQVTNTTEVSIDTSKSLTGITAALASGTYFTGTTLDELKKAIPIIGVYNDSSSETLGTADVLDGVTVTGDYDPTATAEQTLTVKYGEFETVTVKVTLVEDYITEWSVALKDSVAYNEGNTPTAEDVVVKAKWASAPTTEVTLTSGYSVPDTALTTSDTVLTVTLTAKRGTGVDETKDVAISVASAIETLTWDFGSKTVTMYNDVTCTTETTDSKLEGTAGTAYLKDSSSNNAVMKVEIPTGSKIAIDTSNSRVQANNGALFYIPVSVGSTVTVTQKSSASYELGGVESLTYTASAAGYVLFEALEQNYLSKIVVTDVNPSETHTADVVSFVSETNKTTANTVDVLGFVATSVTSSDETIATAVVSDSAIEITSVAPSTLCAARSTTITATGANGETTNWAVTVSRYGKITVGNIEPWTSETLVKATYFPTSATSFTADGVSSDTDVLTCTAAEVTTSVGTLSTSFGSVNSSVKSSFYQLSSASPAKDATILAVKLTLTAKKSITIKSIKGEMNESTTGNISRTVQVGTSDAISLGTGKAITVNKTDIGYRVEAGNTVDIVFTTKATAAASSKTFKQLFADIVITAIVEDDASTTLTPAITLTAVGSSDIKLSYSDGTLTASAGSGATVAEDGYTWYVNNEKQENQTSATLDVSGLTTSGIHSIVVTATDSATNVEYAAQYVLTVQ